MSTEKIQKSFDEIMKAARRSRSTGRTPAWLGEEKKKAIEDLKRDFPRGSTVFMVFRKISASSAIIGVIAIKTDGKRKYALHPNYNVAVVTGLTVKRTPGGTDGILMKGYGYSKTDQIASEIARELYGDPRALTAEVL